MQKHQQWLDNKTYEHHLNCLIRIKQSKRKQQVKSAPLRKSYRQCKDEQIFSQRSPRKNYLKKSNGGLKQRNLVWENFLLGKRIIQTNPVITRKKQVQDYTRNRKIVDLRAKVYKRESNQRFRQQSIYILKKELKQFEENTSRINEKFRVQTACRLKRIMSFKILQLDLFRIKIAPFDEIYIKYKFQGKQNSIKTQIVNYKILFDYIFYFTLSRHKKENNLMQIQIIQIRGLNQTVVGNFNIDIGRICNHQYKIQNKKSNFYKNGKLLGQLHYQYQIIKKKQIQEKF